MSHCIMFSDITVICLLASQVFEVKAGLDCEPDTCVVKFPIEFRARSLRFFKTDPHLRGDMIRDLSNASNDLRIRGIDLIPPELLTESTSRNYIASLSANNRKNFGSSEWQQNYDTNSEWCKLYGRYQAQLERCAPLFIDLNLFRDNSRNTGFRYAYDCETKLEISCALSGCTYDPSRKFNTSGAENVFVVKANVMKPDAKGVDEDMVLVENSTEVIRFPGMGSMTLKLCHARSIYYATQVILKKGSDEKRHGYFVQTENIEPKEVNKGVEAKMEARKSWFLYLK